MASFSSFQAPECTVVRDGKTKVIPAANLVRGDIVKIVAGNNLPADIRLVEVNEMKVDNSSLTGETEKIARTVECTHPENALETHNLAFFGTACDYGTGTGIVIRTGDSTVIGRIANLAAHAENEETTLGREIARFIKIISVFAITLGVIFFVLGVGYGYDIITCLVFAIGIIVANVPEGLLATVTVALTLTAKRMASKNVLVKNLQAIETLGSTTCICTDKTGTLTENKMTVTDIWVNNQVQSVYLDREIYDEKKKLDYHEKERELLRSTFGDTLEDKTFKMLHRSAILCSKTLFDFGLPASQQVNEESHPNMSDEERDEENRRLQAEYTANLKKKYTNVWPTVGDASETGLIKFFQIIEDIETTRKNQPVLKYNGNRVEIPFNSSHKFALTVHEPVEQDIEEGNSGMLLFMKGAPERVWDRCNTILVNGKVQRMSKYKKHMEETNKAFGREGRRVLGFAYTWLKPEETPEEWVCKFTTEEQPNFRIDDLTFIGLVALQDPPRAGVKEAVKTCKNAGIKVIMVTGDQPITAASIAKQVTIFTKKTSVDLQEEEGLDIDEAERRADSVCVHGDRLQAAMASLGPDAGEDEIPEQLQYWIRKPEVAFARTSPAQKLIIVKACQSIGHIVAVTGDGVNDSPAIKKADIGIAMNIVGSDVAKDSADMLLLDDNFASIVKGVEEGRLVFDNLKKCIVYVLASNIPEIGPFIVFIACQFPLPLTTVLILCIDLGTDILPSISFAYEKAELDIMLRKPRNAQTEHLVGARLLSFGYFQIGQIQNLAGFYTYFVVFYDYGFRPDLLYFLALDTGTEPADDDVYTPEHKYKGNTHVGIDDYDDKIVDWLTDKDSDFDLRLWYWDKDEDLWNDCRYPDDESPVTGEKVCYTVEALKYAQAAFFVSIVMCQWANMFIVKTRKLSIMHQGMTNWVGNFSLIFETVITLMICYIEALNSGLGGRPLQFLHFAIPAMPYFTIIFVYDELRKWAMRDSRFRNKDIAGWIERYTLY
jgi:sodium/potassium-transporting ATPase subunit alpha